jgi:nitroreductase
MKLAELVRSNRSCRRFQERHPVSLDTLQELVDLARCSASAANRQPLKYILSNHEDSNAAIFSCLSWAAYLSDWPGPAPGERPGAYIVILGDTAIAKNFWCDHGIAAQSILLGAREKGLAGCIFGAIDQKRLRTAVDVPAHCDILLVLAIGKPAETIVIETVGSNGDIRYYRDDKNIHHVPKRALAEIILKSF